VMRFVVLFLALVWAQLVADDAPIGAADVRAELLATALSVQENAQNADKTVKSYAGVVASNASDYVDKEGSGMRAAKGELKMQENLIKAQATNRQSFGADLKLVTKNLRQKVRDMKQYALQLQSESNSKIAEISEGTSSSMGDVREIERELREYVYGIMKETKRVYDVYSRDWERLQEEIRVENKRARRAWKLESEAARTNYKRDLDKANLLQRAGARTESTADAATAFQGEGKAKTEEKFAAIRMERQEMMKDTKADLVDGRSEEQSVLAEAIEDKGANMEKKYDQANSALEDQDGEVGKMQVDLERSLKGKKMPKDEEAIGSYDAEISTVADKAKGEAKESRRLLSDEENQFIKDKKLFQNSEVAAQATLRDTMNSLSTDLKAKSTPLLGAATTAFNTAVDTGEAYALAAIEKVNGKETENANEIASTATGAKSQFQGKLKTAEEDVATWTKTDQAFGEQLEVSKQERSNLANKIAMRSEKEKKLSDNTARTMTQELGDAASELASEMEPIKETSDHIVEVADGEIGQNQATMGRSLSGLSQVDSEVKLKLQTIQQKSDEQSKDLSDESEELLGLATESKLKESELDQKEVPATKEDVKQSYRVLEKQMTAFERLGGYAAKSIKRDGEKAITTATAAIAVGSQNISTTLMDEIRDSGVGLLQSANDLRSASRDTSSTVETNLNGLKENAQTSERMGKKTLENMDAMEYKFGKKIKESNGKNALRISSPGMSMATALFSAKMQRLLSDTRDEIAPLQNEAMDNLDQITNTRDEAVTKGNEIIEKVEGQVEHLRKASTDSKRKFSSLVDKANSKLNQVTSEMQGNSATQKEWGSKITDQLEGAEGAAQRNAMINSKSKIEQQAMIDSKFAALHKSVDTDVYNMDIRQQAMVKDMVTHAKTATIAILNDKSLSDKEIVLKLSQVDGWLASNVKDATSEKSGVESSLGEMGEHARNFEAETANRLNSLANVIGKEHHEAIMSGKLDSKGMTIDALIDEAHSESDAMKNEIAAKVKAAGDLHGTAANELRSQFRADQQLLKTMAGDAERNLEDTIGADKDKIAEGAKRAEDASDFHARLQKRIDDFNTQIEPNNVDLVKKRKDLITTEQTKLNTLTSNTGAVLERTVKMVMKQVDAAEGFKTEQEDKNAQYAQQFGSLMGGEHMQLLAQIQNTDREVTNLIAGDEGRWDQMRRWENATKNWRADVQKGFNDIGGELEWEVDTLHGRAKDFELDGAKDAEKIGGIEAAKIAAMMAQANEGIGEAGLQTADAEMAVGKTIGSGDSGTSNFAKDINGGMSDSSETADENAMNLKKFETMQEQAKEITGAEQTVLDAQKRKAQDAKDRLHQKLVGGANSAGTQDADSVQERAQDADSVQKRALDAGGEAGKAAGAAAGEAAAREVHNLPAEEESLVEEGEESLEERAARALGEHAALAVEHNKLEKEVDDLKLRVS